MPRPLVAGNWKMNGGVAHLQEVEALKDKLAALTSLPACDVAICPPATLLDRLIQMTDTSQIGTGAQDCHTASSGAHTGDIAAAMIKDLGADYVIVGHSERRADHGETSATVKAKAEAGLKEGLTVIVCVGETEATRDAGNAEAFVTAQVQDSLPHGATAETVIIAYEPVWAIGTGRTPTSGDVETMHSAIRTTLANILPTEGGQMRILYGGSVKPGNARELMAVPGVDGALVGGASLKADDFFGIIEAAYC